MISKNSVLVVSIIALMTAMSAHAEVASQGYVDEQIEGVNEEIGYLEEYVGTGIDLHTSASTLSEAVNELADSLGNIDFVEANPSIGSGEYAKISYDEKGLVTGGADLELEDLPEDIIVDGTGTTVTHSEDGGYAVNVTVDGSVAEDDTGLVTGGDVWSAIDDAVDDAMDDVALTYQTKIGNSTAGQIVVTTSTDGVVDYVTPASSVPEWGVTNDVVVTDTAVRDAIIGLTTDHALGTTNEVIKTISEYHGMVDVTTGKIVNSEVADNAAIADSKISATGSIASSNTGLVTGGTVYTEGRPAATDASASGSGYLGAPASTSVATNLTALDTALKAIHPRTGEVKIPSGSSTSSTLSAVWIQ